MVNGSPDKGIKKAPDCTNIWIMVGTAKNTITVIKTEDRDALSKTGAPRETRTPDPLITNQVLFINFIG